MEKYKNYGGDSNINAYEIGDDRITVVFDSGRYRNYLYTYNIPGREHVEKMKKLAQAGEGLNSYIKTRIGSNYEDKW